MTLVFLHVENFRRFVLFVLGLFRLFFMSMLSIVSLFMKERIVEGLFLTMAIFMAGIRMVMAMAMGVTVTMGVAMTMSVAVSMSVTVTMRMRMLVGMSMLNVRSCVRMGDMYPRLTQVALKRVCPRFMAIGTVLARLLIVIRAGQINDSAHW